MSSISTTSPPTATLPPPGSLASFWRPRRFVPVLAELAFMGVFGFAALLTLVTLVPTFIGVGVALALIFGVGIPFLISVPYMLYGVAWFEIARINGLYGLDVPKPKAPKSTRTGWRGYAHTLWLQTSFGPMWRSLANFAISSLLGLLTLIFLQTFAIGATSAFSFAYGGQ